jgi:hypothetical protein
MRPYGFCVPRPTSNLRFLPVGLLGRSGLALLWLVVLAPESRSETAAAFPPPTATMFRQLNAVVQLTFEVGDPLLALVYDDFDESFGLGEGAYQDIVAANVSDPEPFPSGSADSGAFQASDLASTSSNGDWMFDGNGDAFGHVDLSAYGRSNGSLFAVSVANTTFDVTGPSAAYLDAELISSLTTATGSFVASLAVCEVGAACLVDLSISDSNPDPLVFEQVGFHGPLVLPGPGSYQLRLRAQASAGVIVPGVADFVATDGQASWDAVLTVPEPSSGRLGFVAVGAIAAMAALRHRTA